MTEKNAFYQIVEKAQIKNDSLLVVGLDPSKIPEKFKGQINAISRFLEDVVNQTADQVCAIKPQFGHFGSKKRDDIDDSGEDQLVHIVQHIHDNYPDIPVILDHKVGDIGSTAEEYGLEAFDKYDVDAETINVYMGKDTVNPFTDWTDKGIIVVCRTSNPSARDFQDLPVIYQGETIPLYEVVARKVFYEWNESGNCCLVMGGIRKDDMAALTAMETVRELVGDDIMFLVPGIGAQGGDEKITVEAGKDSHGRGMMINSSRGIIYADNSAKAARDLREKINQYR